MICKKCGALIEDDSAECKFCGMQYEKKEDIAELSENDADAAYEDTEENAADFDDVEELLDENELKRRKQLERMHQEKKEQLDEIENRRNQKKRRQRRNKILIVLGILVAVAGGVTGGLYIYNNSEPIVVTEVTAVPATAMPTVTIPVVESPTPLPSPTAAPQTTSSSSWRPTGSGTSDSNGASSSSAGSGTSNSAGTTSGNSSSSSSSSSQSTKPSTSTNSSSGGKYTAKGGFKNGKFESALITGGEVIDIGTKKYMTFDYNGSTYYANVDSGAYTSYIQGKPFTIKAFPTSEKYNGYTVYEITSITNYSGSYIFPSSGFKLLTTADLKGKTAKELALGRNEIYARHGREFKTKEYQNYFNGCSWYSPNPSYDYSDDSNNLNSIERENAKFIKEYEDKLK